MSLSTWLANSLATLILSITPGPGVFSSLSSGLRHGVRPGAWNGVGMQAANLMLVAIVSLGLGAILLASETLFTLVKWIGVAYLVYLGIAAWRAPPQVFEEDASDTAHTVKNARPDIRPRRFDTSRRILKVIRIEQPG